MKFNHFQFDIPSQQIQEQKIIQIIPKQYKNLTKQSSIISQQFEYQKQILKRKSGKILKTPEKLQQNILFDIQKFKLQDKFFYVKSAIKIKRSTSENLKNKYAQDINSPPYKRKFKQKEIQSNPSMENFRQNIKNSLQKKSFLQQLTELNTRTFNGSEYQRLKTQDKASYKENCIINQFNNRKNNKINNDYSELSFESSHYNSISDMDYSYNCWNEDQQNQMFIQQNDDIFSLIKIRRKDLQADDDIQDQQLFELGHKLIGIHDLSQWQKYRQIHIDEQNDHIENFKDLFWDNEQKKKNKQIPKIENFTPDFNHLKFNIKKRQFRVENIPVREHIKRHEKQKLKIQNQPQIDSTFFTQPEFFTPQIKYHSADKFLQKLKQLNQDVTKKQSYMKNSLKERFKRKVNMIRKMNAMPF